jgi:glycosyltransferase involved in cell wall biosynthesis
VLFFGKYIPLHGIDTILNAANLLKKEKNIHFRMHGTGQLKEDAVRQAQSLGLENVTFTDWLEDASRLSSEFAPYQVCLGAFGDTRASRMTIQNKIYEGMAMRKAVITGDSPTVRSVFTDRDHLILCPRADPAALADAIVLLRDDAALLRHISENGYRMYTERFSTKAIGHQAKKHLEELVNRGKNE